MAIKPIPPAFPVPVLPQVFDTSLSYYELLAKLTESLNAMTAQVNENTANIAAIQGLVTGMSQQVTALSGQVATLTRTVSEISTEIGNLPELVETVSDALAQEIADRADADDSLARQIAAVSNIVQTLYVSFNDLHDDYMLGGVTFQLLTQAEYDALETYVAKRVYFIWNGSAIAIRYHETAQGTGGAIDPGLASTFPVSFPPLIGETLTEFTPNA